MQFVDQIRQLLISLNPGQQSGVGNFWRNVRAELERQDPLQVPIIKMVHRVYNREFNNHMNFFSIP